MNVFDENNNEINVTMDTNELPMDAASAGLDETEKVDYAEQVEINVDSSQAKDIAAGYFGETVDKHEAYARKGRNQEYYKDPTYHYVRRNNDINSAPVYHRRKSKRFEVIGLIIRILDISGFELADRIVLRDKETGEILR